MRIHVPMTVDAVGDDESVIAETYCQHVSIREDGDGTVAFFVKLAQGEWPKGWRKMYSGETFTFNKLGLFYPNEVAGYVKTESGSAQFSVVEW